MDRCLTCDHCRQMPLCTARSAESLAQCELMLHNPARPSCVRKLCAELHLGRMPRRSYWRTCMQHTTTGALCQAQVQTQCCMRHWQYCWAAWSQGSFRPSGFFAQVRPALDLALCNAPCNAASVSLATPWSLVHSLCQYRQQHLM